MIKIARIELNCIQMFILLYIMYVYINSILYSTLLNSGIFNANYDLNWNSTSIASLYSQNGLPAALGALPCYILNLIVNAFIGSHPSHLVTSLFLHLLHPLNGRRQGNSFQLKIAE